MIVDESIANIQRTVAHLKKEDTGYDANPAVVVAPTWWIDLVRNAFREKMETPDDAIDSVAECKLIVKDDLAEPVTVAHDGRIYPVMPVWARRANAGQVT